VNVAKPKSIPRTVIFLIETINRFNLFLVPITQESLFYQLPCYLRNGWRYLLRLEKDDKKTDSPLVE
jgi:hypothetical protein